MVLGRGSPGSPDSGVAPRQLPGSRGARRSGLRRGLPSLLPAWLGAVLPLLGLVLCRGACGGAGCRSFVATCSRWARAKSTAGVGRSSGGVAWLHVRWRGGGASDARACCGPVASRTPVPRAARSGSSARQQPASAPSSSGVAAWCASAHASCGAKRCPPPPLKGVGAAEAPDTMAPVPQSAAAARAPGPRADATPPVQWAVAARPRRLCAGLGALAPLRAVGHARRPARLAAGCAALHAGV